MNTEKEPKKIKENLIVVKDFLSKHLGRIILLALILLVSMWLINRDWGSKKPDAVTPPKLPSDAEAIVDVPTPSVAAAKQQVVTHTEQQPPVSSPVQIVQYKDFLVMNAKVLADGPADMHKVGRYDCKHMAARLCDQNRRLLPVYQDQIKLAVAKATTEAVDRNPHIQPSEMLEVQMAAVRGVFKGLGDEGVIVTPIREYETQRQQQPAKKQPAPPPKQVARQPVAFCTATQSQCRNQNCQIHHHPQRRWRLF